MIKHTIPITPKPQSRPRFNSYGKRAYEDKDMTEYKQRVKQYLLADKPKMIDKGAISIAVTFYVMAPGYLITKNKQPALEKEILYVDKRPDIDNYYKAVTDAAEGILYKNDGQIAAVTMQKLYSLSPRTEIVLEVL